MGVFRRSNLLKFSELRQRARTSWQSSASNIDTVRFASPMTGGPNDSYGALIS